MAIVNKEWISGLIEKMMTTPDGMAGIFKNFLRVFVQ
jgi:hypothetical protein